METVRTKTKNTFETLKAVLGLKNVMQTPQIEKVVVSVGFGSEQDKNKIKLIEDRLTKVTGQKPVTRLAKQSIASFKLREGEQIGYQVTLRGERMNDFLDKLINIALPRTKDFRGISVKSFDAMGNYTLGIKEHTIFPEAPDEELKDVFGMAITVVTTTPDKKNAEQLLRHLGFPFQNIETKK